MAFNESISRAPRLMRSRRFVRTALVLGLVAPVSLLVTSSADAAPSAVPLGTTASFGVLAGAGITDTGPTTVNGDIGTFPTISITGAGSMTIDGTNQGGDSVTQQAKTDLVIAYDNAASQSPTMPISADLGGQTLAPGVYSSASTIGLTGTLTLNGGGDPNAVFIFQAGSSLTTASSSQVVLANGAQSCNVFWQVGSSATLGTGSSFLGTVLAQQSITVTSGVTVGGRVLAENGAVTLDTDTISTPSCSTSTTTTTTTAATTTTAPGGFAIVTTTSSPTASASATAKKTAAAKAAAAKKAASHQSVSYAEPPIRHAGFTG